jgi:DNA-binding transcriptional MocR family regulator
MNPTPLTHHSDGLKLRHPIWYIASLTISPWARLLLMQIEDAIIKDRRVRLSQASWAEQMHCSLRTVTRALKELRVHGLIRVIRRGKKLTNVYRLSRNLWGRITGRFDRAPQHPLLPYLSDLRRKFCPGYGTVAPTPLQSTA